MASTDDGATRFSWVTPGQVLIEEFGWGANRNYGSERVIDRVYANGNFTVVGEKGQWRPGINGARKASAGRYDRLELVPLTDETRKNIEAAKLLSDSRYALVKESKRLDILSRSSDTDAVISAALAIPNYR